MMSTGTIDNPFDLVSAMQSPRVWPGDTLLLRGGTYNVGNINVLISGATGNPITIKSYPGEQAKINGGFTIPTSDLHFYDLEVYDASTKRQTNIAGSDPADITRVNAFVLTGARNKVINCVIHDNNNGIAAWQDSNDTEIYGNVLFHTGWTGPDRGHGHEVYSQNNDASHPKVIRNNIIFNAFADNLTSIYGANNEVSGYIFSGNTFFGGVQAILGGDSGIDVQGNYFYNLMANFTSRADFSNVRDVIVKNNYFVSTTVDKPVLAALDWKSLDVESNTLVAITDLFDNPILVQHRKLVGDTVTWNNNAYYHNMAINPFNDYSGGFLTYAAWKSTYSYDAASTFTAGLPQTNVVYVRPNKYKVAANITIYNWQGLEAVDVDLSSVTGLSAGDGYRLISVQDYFNDRVTGIVPENQTISVSMTSHAVAKPTGWAGDWYANTFPQFGCFVLEHL